MAIMAAQGLGNYSDIVSPGNVAFAKANLSELRPKLEAASSGLK
jgi:hypothetical protein